jgi:hypothetical protein
MKKEEKDGRMESIEALQEFSRKMKSLCTEYGIDLHDAERSLLVLQKSVLRDALERAARYGESYIRERSLEALATVKKLEEGTWTTD